MTFYVIDTENSGTSWPDKDNAHAGERFRSAATAMKRAKHLAKHDPGKRFEIVETICEVMCPVGAAVVTKR